MTALVCGKHLVAAEKREEKKPCSSAQKAAQVNIDEYRVHTAMMEERNKMKEKEKKGEKPVKSQ